MNYLRKAIDLQISWSNRLDMLLPDIFRVDGNRSFVREFVHPYLTEGTVVYDVGGGKQPMIPVEAKTRLGMRVIGIDIDEKELRSAPPGAYDSTICCDITKYHGNADGDVVICQALLEHVPNVAEALRSIDSILKPGGVALLFVPSSNAAYAKLNLLLPERAKRAILFSVFPNPQRSKAFEPTMTGVRRARSRRLPQNMACAPSARNFIT